MPCENNNPVVGIIMGSESDMPAMEPCMKQLDEFGIPYEVKVASAHRKPAEVHEWASTAHERGIRVIVAAAGKAAHLGGVVAAYTPNPVITVPMKTSDLGGLDSLLSMVQMPSGVPVACVAINGAKNAAILAGGNIGTHLQMGIGDGVIPDNLNQSIYSNICIISDEEAIQTARDLARKEGLMCGISSGTNVAAAIKLARKLGKGKTVVTVLPDTAERYFSTPLFENE